ncbi:hypothetical protein SB521682_2307 [Shigella boydii 5216-82]|nr:hypothetical protein SB521682_2307 [Shigella boydii 5216-82]
MGGWPDKAFTPHQAASTDCRMRRNRIRRKNYPISGFFPSRRNI